jgi:Co/Zn/Cd efflux system component
MIAMAALAGIVNLYCLRLLQKLQDKDVNLRAATTFSFNDFISNGGIIVAGVVVLVTGASWPDLVVGVAVAGIAIYGGIGILRDVHCEQRTAYDDG